MVCTRPVLKQINLGKSAGNCWQDMPVKNSSLLMVLKIFLFECVKVVSIKKKEPKTIATDPAHYSQICKTACIFSGNIFVHVDFHCMCEQAQMRYLHVLRHQLCMGICTYLSYFM